ncbi:MAG TPA: aromatic amino acid lyase, partial [Thermomicrobiales bacterium]|nr:aromatic amino acid lyase [Thermomicrobiales bacterium]
AGQEDHNSMGWSAGIKLRRVLANLGQILGIEALCAAQALDLRAPLTPGPATGVALRRVREDIPFLKRDAFLAPDLAAAAKLVGGGALAAAVAAVVDLQ